MTRRQPSRYRDEPVIYYCTRPDCNRTATYWTYGLPTTQLCRCNAVMTREQQPQPAPKPDPATYAQALMF